MEINGKIKLFVNDKESKEKGKFKAFRTTISTLINKEKGIYRSAPVNVIFSKKSFTEEQLSRFESRYYYDIEVIKGFISCDSNYALYFVITEAKVLDKHELKKKEKTEIESKDLPF